MMANINFLERKTKNSPAFKLIQAHIQQRESHLNNTIYTQIKEQQTRKFSQNQNQDRQFDTKIEKKLTEEPGLAMAKAFSRTNHKENQERKRKIAFYQSLSPKRSYQLETQASVGRKQRKIKSLLTEDTLNASRQLSRTQTLTPNPEIPHRVTSAQIISDFQKVSLRSSTKKAVLSKKISRSQASKKLSRSLSAISGQRFNTIEHEPNLSQVEYFNELICEIRKSSKKFEQSLVSTQQQFQRVEKVHSKIDQHFGSLLLEAKEFPDIEFNDLSNMTKADRYKFSSNYILENLLTKNDQEVQEWIEREKHKQLRMKGSALVHLTRHVVSEREIKRLTTNEKNELMIRKDQRINKFLENPEQQINRIRLERNIVRQTTLTPKLKVKTERKPEKTIEMSMTDYGKNFKEIKEYEKRKFVSKTTYQPKRKSYFPGSI